MSSVRDTANGATIPSGSAPSGGAAPAGTDYDSGYESSDPSTSSATKGAETQKPATNFWDQVATFNGQQEARERKMNSFLGDVTAKAAAGSGDANKAAEGAFSQAGVTTPPKGTLSKVRQATQNNPAMQELTNYMGSGSLGGTPAPSAQAVTDHIKSLANQVAQTSGLGSLPSTESGIGSNLVQKTAAIGTGAAADPAASTAAGTAASTTAPATGTTSHDPVISGANLMSIVFLAMANSMDADNKTKQARINDMQKDNKISEIISNYITNTLQPAQAELDKKTAGKDPSKTKNASVHVELWENVNADELFQDKNGNLDIEHTSKLETKAQGSTLSQALTAAQGWAQTASNNSEQASNRFQATDNQCNQTFNMLVAVLKSINDTVSAQLRNSV